MISGRSSELPCNGARESLASWHYGREKAQADEQHYPLGARFCKRDDLLHHLKSDEPDVSACDISAGVSYHSPRRPLSLENHMLLHLNRHFT